jgi:uncharacterized protein (TIGR02246 family)
MIAESTTDIRRAIEAANQQFMTAFARADAAGMAALYTPDGKLLPTHSDFMSGTQAIQAFWQSVMDMGVKEAALETLEAEALGDTAHEVGQYRLSGGAGQVLDQGKYIVIWKRQGGQWKLHRDIWNSSRPATTP